MGNEVKCWVDWENVTCFPALKIKYFYFPLFPFQTSLLLFIVILLRTLHLILKSLRGKKSPL